MEECLAIGQLVGWTPRRNWAEFGYRDAAGFDYIGLALGDVLNQSAGLEVQVADADSFHVSHCGRCRFL